MVRILFFLGLVTLVYSQAYQSYVDEQLVRAGLQSGAILDHDGSVLASSPGLSLKDNEGATLVAKFNDPSLVIPEGITINDIKYFGIKGDEQSLYGKKGPGGVIVVKTAQTIIVGVYDESLQPGNAASIVETLGDYLRESGY